MGHVELSLGSTDIPHRERTDENTSQSVKHDDSITMLNTRQEASTSLYPHSIGGVQSILQIRYALEDRYNTRALFRGTK